MTSSRSLLAAAAVAAAAIVPAHALAMPPVPPNDSTYKLQATPVLQATGKLHATLTFTAKTLPKTSSGAISGRVDFYKGANVGAIRLVGSAGSLKRYEVSITETPTAWTAGKLYFPTFKLGTDDPIGRRVHLKAQR